MSSFEESPAVSHYDASDRLDIAQESVRRFEQRDRGSQGEPAISSLRPVLLCLLLLAALALGCGAVRAQGTIPDRELVVATKEAPPFAMKQPDGNWSGISIELWRKIAAGAHLRFRLVETQNVQDLLDEIAKGTLDAGVAAVTVTAARARSVDFTQPFYNTGLGIAVPIHESAWVSIGRALLSFGFFQAVTVLLCFAMAVGFLIWLLERRKTEHFGGGAKGLGSSFGGRPLP
ncbi:transporter substrate-binding domain-containing protein [Bradyrhizobium sp. AZCC 1721]|uniref:transporter substrate-binding domain-containing protein n=1 Tax=Bradyrhizobium sp. AZCC 1721 TaxID=3117016 RepID=UPI002FF1E0F9